MQEEDNKKENDGILDLIDAGSDVFDIVDVLSEGGEAALQALGQAAEVASAVVEFTGEVLGAIAEGISSL